ncbi:MULTISPECIES: DNA topoisomerase IB [unclassified Pseudoclavibacter]|uniref:DNA topoisomerase IB n=1 Tax=unclassified Pseudoclavibacter TaxID=2615177 RepID=UPI0012F3FC20|nr:MULTISPECIES: DNA topoisomerase IB [unclassified Pseudoclavibacter]MBF4460157.1 DNA topoisomerase IB [Pseudoclavibacter sp. VKM Ac-2867]VXC15614.1 DNA topoisomerase [Pseudoclavibacter sp. 8L]
MVRLRRWTPAAGAWTRHVAGSGFSYRDERGERIVDARLRERLASLAIPPAWQDVRIAPHENAHVLALGVDALGRTQYIYHPDWTAKRQIVTFDRALELSRVLPAARRSATSALRTASSGRDASLAASFKLLDTAFLRVGSERSAKQFGHRGLTTLLNRHILLQEEQVLLEFKGKSGVPWSALIEDGELVSFLGERKGTGSPGRRILAWKDGRAWRRLAAREVNDDIRMRTKGEFTAKDFRTLHGTVFAAGRLAELGVGGTVRERKSLVAQAVRDTAELLGNTPAVARSSYIDPRVIEAYDEGRVVVAGRGSGEAALRELLLGSSS